MDADREIPSKLLMSIMTIAVAILCIFLVPLILLLIASYFFLQLFLILGVWLCWNSSGKDMLVIYSDSPYWKEYFERGFLPLVIDRALVLNWSERAKWPVFSLKAAVFKLFKGGYEFNLMLIQFPFFCWPRRIRFYSAFHESKHGDSTSLSEIEKKLSLITGDSIDLSEFHKRKAV